MLFILMLLKVNLSYLFNLLCTVFKIKWAWKRELSSPTEIVVLILNKLKSTAVALLETKVHLSHTVTNTS